MVTKVLPVRIYENTALGRPTVKTGLFILRLIPSTDKHLNMSFSYR